MKKPTHALIQIMRFKILLAYVLACAFSTLAIASENYSSELDNDARAVDPKFKVSNDAEFVEMISEIVQEQAKPDTTTSPRTTTKITTQKTIPTDSIPLHPNNGVTPRNQTKSFLETAGALKMSEDFYLGELGFDMNNDNGYDWCKCRYVMKLKEIIKCICICMNM